MESPCIDVCVINPATGVCEGCGRTIEQIARWSSFTDSERRRIMDTLAAAKASGAPR